MAPKRRTQYTKEYKKRICLFYNTIPTSGKRPLQQQVVDFAKNVLKIDINRSFVSKQTSKKYKHLDTPSQALSTSSRVRHRTRPYKVLEIALYDQMKRIEERIAISGAILKAMASNFYNRVPQYKD